jgi:nucleotide-binding universal stress UspA family protein
MKRFENILFVVGDTIRAQRAFEFALKFAEHNQARLSVLSVIDEPGTVWECFGQSSESVENLLIAERYEHLHQFIETVSDKPFRGRIDVVTGTTFIEITRYAISNGIDLLIKPASGLSGPVRSVLFGSTAMHLMRKCPCPVWVIKDQPHASLSKILVAVSASEGPSDSEGDLLDISLIQVGSNLAHYYGAQWDIVNAWGLFGEMALSSERLGIAQSEIQKALEEERLAACSRVNKLIEKASPVVLPNRLVVEKGQAARVIPELAYQSKADLVVMGSVAKTGIAGLLMSDNAELTLNQLDCSAFTLKPGKFVSPIA